MWYVPVHQSHVPTPFIETNVFSEPDFYKLLAPGLG
jgi:hypothetical protein